MRRRSNGLPTFSLPRSGGRPLLLALICVLGLLLAARLALPLSAGVAHAAGGAYSLSWFTVASQSESSSSGGYALSGTAGQPAASTASTGGGAYSLSDGFWNCATAGACATGPDSGPRNIFLPVAAKSVQVYASNFAGGVTEHWTPPALTTAPNGQRFLGEFGNQTATLNLSGLEAHRRVLVSFDLYIIRSWDGNQTVVPPDFDPYKGLAKGGTLPTIGPDQFRVNADGATLLDATFSNWGQFSQNYPAVNSPAHSGASAVNSLGYRFVLYKNPQDATYHITLDFAHSAPMLALNFLAAGLQALGDESWGVDHVVVVVH